MLIFLKKLFAFKRYSNLCKLATQRCHTSEPMCIRNVSFFILGNDSVLGVFKNLTLSICYHSNIPGPRPPDFKGFPGSSLCSILIFLSDTSFARFSKLTIMLSRILKPVLIFQAEIL